MLRIKIWWKLRQLRKHHEKQTKAWNEYLDGEHRLECKGKCDVVSLYKGFRAGWDRGRNRAD